MQGEVSISELILPSGRVVLLESPVGDLGPRDVGLKDEIQLGEVLKDLTEFSAMLLEAAKAVSPTEAEIELQVGVDAATGRLLALMAQASASGGIKLRLKWQRGD